VLIGVRVSWHCVKKSDLVKNTKTESVFQYLNEQHLWKISSKELSIALSVEMHRRD
jgi:hypothetical protein